MKITMIAAMTPDRVIGSAGGGVPWSGKVPRDQKHFREYTRGKWLLLGRTTYEEMEGWFTTQKPLVLTSRSEYQPFEPRHQAVPSVEKAIELAQDRKAEELVIGGGSAVYHSAIDHANRLNLTIVGTQVTLSEARYFPNWDDTEWYSVSEDRFVADEKNEFALTFRTLRRR